MVGVIGDPITEILDAAETLFRDVGNRQRAHQATLADLTAVCLAIRAVRTVADDLEASKARPLSSEDVATLNGVRRALRRYELFYWQTAPEFLQAP